MKSGEQDNMKVIWPAILFAVIVVSSYATSITITTTNLQTKSGILQDIYFQTVSGPGSTTPSTNTALAPSGGSGSYSIASGTSGYLWSPSFSTATTTPAGKMTFDIWGSASPNTFGLDGSASGSGSGPVIVTLSTTTPNDLLYISIVLGNGATVSSITSSPSLSWTQRISVAFSSNLDLETWYSAWSSSGTITITVNLSSGANSAAVAYGISGANTASPFDGNAAIPNSASGTGSSASVTISTSNSNDFIIGALGTKGNPGLTVGTGFNLVLTKTVGSGANSRQTSDQYEVVTAAQTNLAVGYSWGSTNDWGIVGDAVVAASRPLTITLLTTNSAGTLGSTLLGSTSTNPVLSTKSQTFTVFSINAGSIPAGGYLEIILTAPSAASITVYWGLGQPTNFQVPRVVLT